MRIYGESWEDLQHGNPLMNVTFASAVGNLCMASVDVFKEIMKSDAKQPKMLLKELTGIDEIDRNFDFGNYLDARNPDTGEIISTAREDGKASSVELPEEIEIPVCMETYPTYIYLPTFMKSLNEKEYVTFCNAIFFEIKGKEASLKKFGFARENDMQYLEEYVSAIGDKMIAGEEAKTEHVLIESTIFLMMSSMRNSLYDELYQLKDIETEKSKLAMELNGYVKKVVWRKWNTNYLEEFVKHVLSKQ